MKNVTRPLRKGTIVPIATKYSWIRKQATGVMERVGLCARRESVQNGLENLKKSLKRKNFNCKNANFMKMMVDLIIKNDISFKLPAFMIFALHNIN